MTPRPNIVWLDLEDSSEENRRKVAESPYSRFPVCRGELDDVAGVVRAKGLLAGLLTGGDRDPSKYLREPLFVPERMAALQVLAAFRGSGRQMALVVDEYSSIAGLVTAQDVLEAIVGQVTAPAEVADPRVVRRSDDSWLLDGTLPVDDLAELLGVRALPVGTGTRRSPASCCPSWGGSLARATASSGGAFTSRWWIRTAGA
jgi:putative hemolysin